MLLWRPLCPRTSPILCASACLTNNGCVIVTLLGPGGMFGAAKLGKMFTVPISPLPQKP